MGNVLDIPESFFDVVNQRLPGAPLATFKKNFALSVGSFLMESDHSDSLDTYLLFDLDLGNETDPTVHTTSIVSLINGVIGERCVEFINDYFLPLLKNHHLLKTDPQRAICEIFKTLDSQFFSIANENGLSDGCTAVTVMISKDMLHFVSLGDNLGYLVAEDKEKDEIIFSEIGDGDYNRGFGFFELNGFTRAKKEGISYEPFIKSFKMSKDFKFVILGTWTFWENIQVEEAVRCLLQRLNEPGVENEEKRRVLDRVCGELVDKASMKNNKENISCVIVSIDHLANIIGQ